MNADLRKPLSTGLVQAALLGALLLTPSLSHAQTFFGAGGSANPAPNVKNVALGYWTLFNSTGSYNTAIGYAALSSNTTGHENTALGFEALVDNTEGIYNTALGSSALYYNQKGSANTATGNGALQYNISGGWNTADGYLSLLNNTSGAQNTASGAGAMAENQNGSNNTATGFDALYSNLTGNDNTVTGLEAMHANTYGGYNTAEGVEALFENTTGSYNSATGFDALYANTTGNNNIAVGHGAGANLTTGSNNIAIGNAGVAGEGGSIRLGTAGMHKATYIAGISGVTASGGVAVYINANGQLGTLPSSRRFKQDIHAMGQTSAKVMQLRPVTFRYKQAGENGTHPLQYGLIAEEVAKVYPDLVQYDQAGKPLAVYYHLLTPMLLNELQKAHCQAQVQQAELAALKSEVAALKQAQQHQLSALTKLTALMEASQSKVQIPRAVVMQH